MNMRRSNILKAWQASSGRQGAQMSRSGGHLHEVYQSCRLHRDRRAEPRRWRKRRGRGHGRPSRDRLDGL